MHLQDHFGTITLLEQSQYVNYAMYLVIRIHAHPGLSWSERTFRTIARLQFVM